MPARDGDAKIVKPSESDNGFASENERDTLLLPSLGPEGIVKAPVTVAYIAAFLTGAAWSRVLAGLDFVDEGDSDGRSCAIGGGRYTRAASPI